MLGSIAYLSLLGAIVVSILVGWKLALPANVAELPVWRRRLLFLGLFANALSLASFLTVSFAPRLIANWPTHTFFNYNWWLSVPVAVGSILLGAFGRGVPRVLIILNGLVLTWLWFNLGASSL
jgi:hypothetical protein